MRHMKLNSNCKPDIDGEAPSQAPAHPQKRCIECRACLSISHFGLDRRRRGGYQSACKLCRSNYTHRKYALNITQDFIRNVNKQNRHIVDMASQSSERTFACVAFSVDTFTDYRVTFDFDGVIRTVSVWKPNPEIAFDYTLIQSISYSPDAPNIQDQVGYILRNLNIRLELSDVDAITTKRLVYLQP